MLQEQPISRCFAGDLLRHHQPGGDLHPHYKQVALFRRLPGMESLFSSHSFLVTRRYKLAGEAAIFGLTRFTSKPLSDRDCGIAVSGLFQTR